MPDHKMYKAEQGFWGEDTHAMSNFSIRKVNIKYKINMVHLASLYITFFRPILQPMPGQVKWG